MKSLQLLAVVGALGLAACGTTTDDRPKTAQFVIDAVLRPNCANIGCHSTAARAAGYDFDDPDAAISALKDLVLVGSPASESFLMEVLTRDDDRMPADQPMSNGDIGLIEAWINEGAEGLQ